MYKFLSILFKGLLSVLGLSLLVYTAFRTLDLVGVTLPPGQQIMAIFALVAFDGGLLLWPGFFLFAANGTFQRVVGLVMIVVSFAGVITALVADTFYQLTARGAVTTADPAFVSTAVWVLVTVIGINIAAVLAVHISEPDTWRRLLEDIDREGKAAAPAAKAQLAPVHKAPAIPEGWAVREVEPAPAAYNAEAAAPKASARKKG